jgi:hypothetical protein
VSQQTQEHPNCALKEWALTDMSAKFVSLTNSMSYSMSGLGVHSTTLWRSMGKWRFLTWAVDRNEWSASCVSNFTLEINWMGGERRSRHCREAKYLLPLPGIELEFYCCPGRSLVTQPTKKDFRPWRWRWYFPPKRRFTSHYTELYPRRRQHSVIKLCVYLQVYVKIKKRKLSL